MLIRRRYALLLGLFLAGAFLVGCPDSKPTTEDPVDAAGDLGRGDMGSDRSTTDTGTDGGGEGCGNGVREGDEECDDGDANANTPNACRTDCTNPDCGDQIVDNAAPYNEECDDGNGDDTDGCTSACMVAVALICQPCSSNQACGGRGNSCVVLEDGNFCATECGTSCPDGFICDQVTDVDGGTVQQCVPASGVCSDCFDPDRDGYGAGPECAGPDCDQTDPEINPAAEEVCDGIDNNCAGGIDEGMELTSFYPDADLDGHGDETAEATEGCVAPEGMVESNDDCDDADRYSYPGAAELCDDKDNDCDGEAETEDVDFDWYPDEDGDGYGNWLADATTSCMIVEGAVTNDDDCDDGNGLVNPGMTEVCDDGFDNNCDFATDCLDATCAETDLCGIDCEEAGLEPNDSPDTATLVTVGSYDGQYACPMNEDWYSITLRADDIITIDVTFLQTDGDIDVYVVDPFGGLLAAGESEDDNEEVFASAPISGDYMILVFLYADAGDTGGAAYDLTIAVEEAPETCHDDGFEENDVLEPAPALEVGNYPDMVACERDFDHYDIALNVDDEVTIDVLFDHELGNIDAALLDTESNLVVEGVSEDSNEQLVYTAPVAGTYKLVVYLYAFGEYPEGNAYELNIAIGEQVGPCEDDRFEDNDVRANPAAVGPGEFPDLMACPNDADFFSVDLNTDDEVTIDLAFTHADGNVDLRLYNPDGVAVAASASIDDGEHIVYTALLSGTFLIEVFYFHPSAEDGNAYTLSIAVNVPDPVCEPDSLEENDSVEDAFTIAEGTLAGLTSCAGDLDWYSISLETGDTLNADLAFTHADADIDLLLADATSTLLTYSGTETDNEELTWETETSGTYYLIVNLWADSDEDPTNNLYTLTTAITPAAVPICTADEYEDNDILDEASEIDAGTYTGLTACEGDDDFYKIDLGVGDEITVNATFSHDQGDIDLYLRNAEETSLASSYTYTDNESLTWTADVSGPVFIQARLFRDAGDTPGNTYGLSIAVVEATPTCTGDALEENDTQATAVSVLSDTYAGLTSCPDDGDYYNVYLLAGGTVTVDLTFDHAEGDIDVDLLQPDGDWVDYSDSETDDESFEYVATEAGVYTIYVYLYEDLGDTPGNTYSMTVDIPSAGSCDEDDDFEENDTADTAAYFVSGTVEGLWACGTDMDYYEVLGLSDETLTIELGFDNDDADIDVEVYPSSQCGLGECTGDPLNDGDEGYSVDDNELVDWEVDAFGFFTVVVYISGAEDGDAAQYSMTFIYE